MYKSYLLDAENFKAGLEMAKVMSSSSLLPLEYRGEKGIGSCLIALEIARGLGISPILVARNLRDHPEHGATFSSVFIMGLLRTCGQFKNIRFEEGEDKNGGFALRMLAEDEDEAGNLLEGPWVTTTMVVANGWDVNNAWWNNTPAMMFRYRASTFFQKLFAPQLCMGFSSTEEVFESEVPVTSLGEGKEKSEKERRTPKKAPPSSSPRQKALLEELNGSFPEEQKAG